MAKRTNNDLQNSTQKTKDRAARIPLITEGELRYSRRVNSEVCKLAPFLNWCSHCYSICSCFTMRFRNFINDHQISSLWSINLNCVLITKEKKNVKRWRISKLQVYKQVNDILTNWMLIAEVMWLLKVY